MTAALDNFEIGLTAVVDLVEDLRTQLNRMREETREAVEHIRCYEDCGTTTEGLAKALHDGWIDPGIDETDDGSFVAWCPACQATHEKIEKVLNTPAPRASDKPKASPPGMLFPTSPLPD